MMSLVEGARRLPYQFDRSRKGSIFIAGLRHLSLRDRTTMESSCQQVQGLQLTPEYS